MSTDWAQRIGRHVTAEGSVIVPTRIAHWLEQKAGVTGDKRISLRDTDPLAYEVLAALHIAALSHVPRAELKVLWGNRSRKNQISG
jgi:hypothetical protein